MKRESYVPDQVDGLLEKIADTALDDDYAAQQPAVVADELVAAAAVVADAFEAVRDDQLDRVGLRSDGSAFTVDSLARYFVHDPVHHLHDVRR